jgi:hypothetical protein
LLVVSPAVKKLAPHQRGPRDRLRLLAAHWSNKRLGRAETVLLVVAATLGKTICPIINRFYEIIEGHGARPVPQTQSGGHDTHQTAGRHLQPRFECLDCA